MELPADNMIPFIGIEIIKNGTELETVRAWTNDKCLATKHYQTLFGDQTFNRLDTLFGAV